MSITSDVRALYFGPNNTRSADVRYPIVSGGTGPCWFRGAHISTTAFVYSNTEKLFHFHDGPSGDTLITFGVGAWRPCNFNLLGEECYIDAPNGIEISSDLQQFIRETMITVFIS